MVLALNMMDELESNGGTININEMERLLKIPVVPISALKIRGSMNSSRTRCTLRSIAKHRPQMIFAIRTTTAVRFTGRCTASCTS